MILNRIHHFILVLTPIKISNDEYEQEVCISAIKRMLRAKNHVANYSKLLIYANSNNSTSSDTHFNDLYLFSFFIETVP